MRCAILTATAFLLACAACLVAALGAPRGAARDDAWLARRPYPPVPIGPAPRYRPPPSPGPRRTCRSTQRIRHLAHLELFADGKVAIVPAALGIGGRWRFEQGRVVGGACWQAIFTTEPTGVVMVAGRSRTLGDLFRIWRQPLDTRRMLSFHGPVRAYVDGRRWPGNPRRIPLSRRAQIVVETGPYIRPHPAYPFPPALEGVREVGRAADRRPNG